MAATKEEKTVRVLGDEIARRISDFRRLVYKKVRLIG